MEFKEIERGDIAHHEALFNLCFPLSNLNRQYLEWLYFSNPLGNVVGFDAMDGEILAAHYACIPTRIGNSLGLLSLNTATHPEYRSKGLYQKLARMTYERWNQEFNFVVGVANAQSSRAFVKHLGFTEMGRLNLRFGELHRPTAGARTWTESEIKWRISSPRQSIRCKPTTDGLFQLAVRPKHFPFSIKSLVASHESLSSKEENVETNRYGFTVDWIKGHHPRIQLPEKMKPSPLVMIYQSLNGPDTDINSWSFPDFDAF
jgi:GNAT superfamily N-acetyltransferase